jgi:homoserine dehydrogenase
MRVSIGIGLLGCGTVGAAVADRLQCGRDAIERSSGVRYHLSAIAVRNTGKSRPSSLDGALFTRDVLAVIDDPRVDCIVECIGGTSEAAEFVERALDRGRHVITANKNLLATQGPRLRALAALRGVTLRFEAAVAGAIPIVRTLDEALAGDDVTSISGVVNGTCTSILSAMENGSDYPGALAEAQRLGYAESDPSHDVDGVDASHKLALLMQLAFGLAVISPRIKRSGISGVTRRDVSRARMLGLRIRLIAAAIRSPGGALAEVGPVLLPEDHDFARTQGAQNIIHIQARDAGTLTLRGNGAGGVATSSAVIGDVVSVLRAIGESHGTARCRDFRAYEPAMNVEPFFGSLPRVSELPSYPMWSDERIAAHAGSAFFGSGKMA